LLTQQVIAATGITLYVRFHAQRAIVNLTTTDIARLSGDQSRVRICQLALKGLIPPKRVKGYEQHRCYDSKKLVYCEERRRQQAARPIREAPRARFTPSRKFPIPWTTSGSGTQQLETETLG
jgi:hypothetical protein